jgi:hypothetical protein
VAKRMFQAHALTTPSEKCPAFDNLTAGHRRG